MNNEILTDNQKNLLIKQLLLDIDNQLSVFNVPSDIHINNMSELQSFKQLIKLKNIPWVSIELVKFVDEKILKFESLVNDNTNIPIIDNTGFDFVNNSYDLEYEKTKFLLEFNSKLKIYGVPSDIVINNMSEFDSLKILVQNFEPNPHNPYDTTSWLNNSNLKTFINNKTTELSDLSDPSKNLVLNIQQSIGNNLVKFKDLLNIDIVPTIDQLSNILNFPPNFDYEKLTNLLKIPNLTVESLPQLATLLNLEEIDLNSYLPNLEIPNLPGFAPFKLPKISSPLTGLNFNRMLDTLIDAQLKDFPETSDWKSVIKYQSAQITSSVFEELSKMTFYIEPGEIRVLTNGSPSTHQGQNINRIKIKLK